jgi:FRG domain
LALNGQWIASYSGSNSGLVVVDVDEVGDHFEGRACAWDANPALPSSLIRFRTANNSNVQHLANLRVVPMDRAGVALPDALLAQYRTNGLSFPATTDADLDLVGDNLTLSWTTAIGTHGSAVAPKTRGGDASALIPLKINTWDQFKKYVNKLEVNRFAFRGQESNIWRLRTSFHRTRRANLERYLSEDIQDSLQKVVSALSKNILDLGNPLHYAAFINLAQHHGYPTPLLDWTWSPYVAAFFAFRNIKRDIPATSKKKVRIYKLDMQAWNRLERFDKLFPVRPQMSVLNALAFENPRVIPQQSISTFTNIDDLEDHITKTAALNNETYIEVIDLPARDRQSIMQELALMGITAGSLFPGLDGACEGLRERNF